MPAREVLSEWEEVEAVLMGVAALVVPIGDVGDCARVLSNKALDGGCEDGEEGECVEEALRADALCAGRHSHVVLGDPRNAGDRQIPASLFIFSPDPRFFSAGVNHPNFHLARAVCVCLCRCLIWMLLTEHDHLQVWPPSFNDGEHR
jgi:hypothetical protein